MSFLVVGNAALQLRRPDLALRFLDRGIAQDPRVAALREKRGLALVMLERPTEARMELEEARRLDPASASACLNLAVLEAQEGRLDAARVLASEGCACSRITPSPRPAEALGGPAEETNGPGSHERPPPMARRPDVGRRARTRQKSRRAARTIRRPAA
jgi:tetratricopeptide (TPR) repeat protein